jgi:hypothetical protein
MGSRVGATYVVRVSRTIDAPLGFAYDWCTDFREDDSKITHSKSLRRIWEKTKQRVIYTSKVKGARSRGGASIVTLHPPDSWHVDSIGDLSNSTGDYHLRKLSSGRTKLDIVFRIRQKSPAAQSKSKFIRHINQIWDKYAAALEKDYGK